LAYLNTNQGNIYYEVCGEGEPLVFLHGITLDSRMWEKQISYFKNYFKVIYYDLRFYGKSDSTIPFYHTEDLKNLLDFLNIKNPNLVGLSRGGRVSIDFTLEFSENVRSLTLANTSLSGFKYPPEVLDRQNTLANLAKTNIQAAKEYWLKEPIFKCALQNSSVTQDLRRIIEQYSGIHWVEGAAKLEKWKILDATEKLHLINVPTLIITGNEDTYYFKNVSKIINDSISHSKLIEIPASGHMVNMEQPQKFNQCLHNFLNEIEN
jgi:pimeloyl-ACP methyl ester carboxylesterase